MSQHLMQSLPHFRVGPATTQGHLPGETVDAGFDAGFEAGIASQKNRFKFYKDIIRRADKMITSQQALTKERHSNALLTILHAVLPDILDTSIHPLIIQQIVDAAQSALDMTLTVKANPALCTEISPSLAKTELQNIDLVPDTSLTDHDVQLIWSDGGFELNLDQTHKMCLSLINEAIADIQGNLPDD